MLRIGNIRIRQRLTRKAVAGFLTASIVIFLLIGLLYKKDVIKQTNFLEGKTLNRGASDNIPSSSLRVKRHILNQVVNETEESLRYAVNLHFWDYVCGYSVEDLRSHPLFPYSPFRRDTADSLFLKFADNQFGARLFGYLHPPVDGFYKFGISSDDCSELWLSASEDPNSVQLIASVGGTGKEWAYEDQFDKYPQQQSSEIRLVAGRKYFFDVLWKQERGRGHLQIVWTRPFSSRIEAISSKYISKYYDDSFIENGLVYLDHLKSDLRYPDIPSHVKEFTKMQEKLLASRSTPYQRDSAEFLSLPHIEFSEINTVLQECDYDPSWMIKKDSEEAKKLGQYEGVHLPHYFNISTSLHPGDQTWNHTRECVGVSLQPMHCQGNDVTVEMNAKWVANKYMSALQQEHPNRFKVHTIVNVEEAKDDKPGKGDRYLLEIALEDFVHKNVRRLSVYLFRPYKTKRLCYPKDFQWTKDVMVHFILTVKNQGSWVQQYIESLSNIYVKTRDTRFNLILTDFDSFDIDLEGALKRSPLPHWQIIKKTGKFHKTSAIQDAIDSIKDPNSIALQTDLHLEFPLNFVDDTRKHCVQGKMGYTPLLMRLACGRYSHKPAGFWEAFGYGIFGLYKSDWDFMGGMDVEKFRNAWGGEDWDFADRVIKAGIEIERLRVPYFFHYFHTKKGMWDNKF